MDAAIGNDPLLPTSESSARAPTLTLRQYRWLLATTAIVSGCGLAAELLLGTLASYLVGNHALAYSMAVGGFLAAMGVGSYLSQFLAVTGDRHQQHQLLLQRFMQVELLLGPLTAVLPLGLFAIFVADGSLWLGLCLATLILGTLAGTEVPLLVRLVEDEHGTRNALAGVMALDYIGALAGSLAFPLLLLPFVGLFPAAAIVGAIPALMVALLGRVFPQLRRWTWLGAAVAIVLLCFAPAATLLSDRLENDLYDAPIIVRTQTQYQRVVLTRFGRDVRLFLDGDLQLSTLDEYRYHEALIHPAISAVAHPRRVLVMGAGDGMAVREVLKWPEVEQVVLVELDPVMVDLARYHPVLAEVNEQALDDERVEILIGDAFLQVPLLPESFDVIVADFPDPDRAELAKLYSQGFYRRLLARLASNGVLVTQASSPFFAPLAIDSIQATLASVGLVVKPYVVDVPSFGPWGFVLASRSDISPDRLELPVPTRFLTAETISTLFNLPGDVEFGRAEINRLGHPVIVGYQVNSEWAAYD